MKVQMQDVVAAPQEVNKTNNVYMAFAHDAEPDDVLSSICSVGKFIQARNRFSSRVC